MLFTEKNIKKYNLVLTKNGNFRNTITYFYHYACLECGYPHLSQTMDGKYCNHNCACKSSIRIQRHRNLLRGRKKPNHSLSMLGINNPNYKGGVTEKNIPLYDTYAPQLEPYEKCIRDPENPKILNVFCTYCDKWYIPTIQEVCNRITGINKNDIYRFYCCDKCKQLCPIYRQVLYPKGHKPDNNRPLQSEWALYIKERDNYTCQICGECGNIAHHIDPVVCNPIESVDYDNGVTLCERCHIDIVHQLPGCTIGELILHGKNK